MSSLNPGKRIEGPLVPVFSAFDADDRLDIESTCKWVDWLIRKGIKLFWTTQGTTHFMCLSDAEIRKLTKALAKVISGRGIFITSARWDWSTRQCREFVDYAAACGADIVKLQIDWRWNPSDDQVFEHYRKIAESSPLPLFAYSSPRGISIELLKRIIIELPQFVGMKNDTDDFIGHEEYLRVIKRYGDLSKFTAMTGGGWESFLFGYNFGARAYGDMVAWFAPNQSIAFHKFIIGREREQAVALLQDWMEPVMEQLKRLNSAGSTWAWGHTVLQLMGFFKSNRMRFPLKTLNPDQVKTVRAFLAEKKVHPLVF